MAIKYNKLLYIINYKTSGNEIDFFEINKEKNYFLRKLPGTFLYNKIFLFSISCILAVPVIAYIPPKWLKFDDESKFNVKNAVLAGSSTTKIWKQ